MAKQALVFRHMEGDTPGRLSGLLAAAGYGVEIVELHRGQAIPALEAYDLMVVLGGAMHAWEEAAHPWLAAEKQAIAEWVGRRAKPYFGICLGHQLLADAMGGEVGLSLSPEIGVHEVAVTAEAEAHPFMTGLAGRHMSMQWHLAEVKRLPDGARALAASRGTAVQAMAVDRHALGVQFHCEWTLETIRSWAAIGWVPALERHAGAGGHGRLLAAAAPHMPAIARVTETLYGNFTLAAGLGSARALRGYSG
jgi:GMP synthase-like glutamine amidotransferase